MYEKFDCLPGNPFLTTPDPDYFYLTNANREALAGLTYAILWRKGLVVLTGEAGTGKTTLMRKVMTSMPAAKVHFSLILNPTLTQSEFLESVLADFGITAIRPSKAQRLAQLQQFLLQLHSEGKAAVLAVDEAHRLSAELLEEIRLLANFELPEAKLLQIVLVGQRELDSILDQENMQQLKQRVSLHFTLSPLPPREVRADVQHCHSTSGATTEHPFVEAAVDSIARCSREIPRLVNVICDSAPLLGYADGLASVGEKCVLEAAKDLQLLYASNGVVQRASVVSAEPTGSDGQETARGRRWTGAFGVLNRAIIAGVDRTIEARALLRSCGSFSALITPISSSLLAFLRLWLRIGFRSPGVRRHDQDPDNLKPKSKGHTLIWFKRWFTERSDRRDARRSAIPGLTAYYYCGEGVSTGWEVLNLSVTGAYIRTKVKWSPGTIAEVTIQHHTSPDGKSAGSRVVARGQCRVVRWGLDGFGVRFLFPEASTHKELRKLVEAATAGRT